MQSWKPTEFANQINLSESNMWGVLKHYIDMCMALEPGTYLFLKDPNKVSYHLVFDFSFSLLRISNNLYVQRLVRLYQVPEDAFAEADEDYDVDEGDDENEEGEEDEDWNVLPRALNKCVSYSSGVVFWCTFKL